MGGVNRRLGAHHGQRHGPESVQEVGVLFFNILAFILSCLILQYYFSSVVDVTMRSSSLNWCCEYFPIRYMIYFLIGAARRRMVRRLEEEE